MSFDKSKPVAAASSESTVAVATAETAPQVQEQAATPAAPVAMRLPDGALTPEAQAFAAHNTHEVVQATIAAVMASLAPILEKLKAPSPKEQAELDELNRKIEQTKRQSRLDGEQEAEQRENLRQMRANCPHRQFDGVGEAIMLVHNQQMTRLPFGLCAKCNEFITPRMWALGFKDPKSGLFIDGPNPVTGKCEPYVKEAHKDWNRVQQLIARQG